MNARKSSLAGARSFTHVHALQFGGYMGELHFVDAPLLYDGTMDGTTGMDAWVDYFEELNGGEDDGSLDFNAFMHNKIQVRRCVSVLKPLGLRVSNPSSVFL